MMWTDAPEMALDDVVPVVAPRTRHSIRIGSVSLNGRTHNLTTSLRDNNMIDAVLRLLPDEMPDVNYLSPLSVVDEWPGGSRISFHGAIDAAEVSSDALTLRASTMSDFREKSVAPMAHRGVEAIELIYLLAKTAGIERENINVDVPVVNRWETVQVALPVLGCAVDESISLGFGVSLCPGPLLTGWEESEVPNELWAVISSAESVAVMYVDGERWLHEAESVALDRIGAALSWMVAQLKDGSAYGPDGDLQEFSRARVRATPRLSDVVLVQGMLSQRAYMRDRTTVIVPPALQANDLRRVAPLPEGVDQRTLLSYRALHRASDESSEPFARLTALWEALEFYAAEVQVDGLISKAQARHIRRNATKDLDPSSRERVLKALGNLSTSSLLMRTFHRAMSEGVPISKSDANGLGELRAIRNDAAHGGKLQTPTREELNGAVSVVSRLLRRAAWLTTRADSASRRGG